MNYLRRNKPHPYRKPLLIVGGVFLLGVLISSFFGSVLVTAVSPVWRSGNAFSRMLGRGVEYFHLQRTLASENIALKERIASLELELTTANLTLSTGRSLSEILGRERRPGEVIASVLTRPPQSPYDLFVIDAGSNENIVLGARVSLPEGPSVGTITDVLPSSAKVKLFSSPDEKTEAVLERGNSPVMLEGRGAGAFRIVVPREIAVEAGDRILSADTLGSLLAVVEEVRVEPTDAFKEILARSSINIFSLRFVSISP